MPPSSFASLDASLGLAHSHSARPPASAPLTSAAHPDLATDVSCHVDQHRHTGSALQGATESLQGPCKQPGTPFTASSQLPGDIISGSCGEIRHAEGCLPDRSLPHVSGSRSGAPSAHPQPQQRVLPRKLLCNVAPTDAAKTQHQQSARAVASKKPTSELTGKQLLALRWRIGYKR